MSSLVVTAEVIQCTEIREAVELALKLANRLGCSVKFGFDGVWCCMPPDGYVEQVLAEYRQDRDRELRKIRIGRLSTGQGTVWQSNSR